jgi:intracellular sulfur oxidation DsrE/DsrF family protein
LEPEEKSHLLNESNRSAELDQRLCRQRKIKELVAHAYDEVPQPGRVAGTPLSRASVFGRAAAAGVLLLLGLTAGLFTQSLLDRDQAQGSLLAADNYILHVISGEPEQMLSALQEAERLLEATETGQVRQVEIVANEQGLNLLRSDVTPFASEISALQESNVVFYACSRTIERLEEKGVEVQLVPETRQAYTALDRVVIRMKDDWKYIKI